MPALLEIDAPGTERSRTVRGADADRFFAHHGLWAPGVRLFRRLRFTAKALIISSSMLLPLLALLAWQLHSQADRSLQARQDATRHLVEVAHGVVAWAHGQELRGELSREQAQQVARRALANLRYGADEYFWINDLQMRMVMHPAKPALDGQDVSGMKDPNGVALFQVFVDTVRRQEQGFVRYQWPKPGREQPVDKLSFVKGFAPWGWVIGSGIYIDDLRQAWQRELMREGAIVVVIVLLSAYLFLSFYRVMNGGMAETRRHLRAMTSGDLTTSPRPWGSDEAASLMVELHAMQDALRHMVQRVRQASQQIVQASAEVASGSMDLSERTEQAAANLEQTAASMEQISATVRSTSEHSHEASGLARRNAQAAEQGGQTMHQVVDTMSRIHRASARIADINGTIDGIAFQTNILALNAAVEAARAGEQGRGFAVVASEVRQLAQRSAAAAREIKGLIGDSVAEVQAGSGIVQQAEACIAGIVSSASQVDRLLDSIAGSTDEQRSGMGQVSQAVQELDRVTQQNAALVEQTAAAASALRAQADALVSEVARFQLPGDRPQATTRPA